MNIEVKDGYLKIKLFDLFESLDKKTKTQAMEEIACDSDIIKFVTQQILDKWTDNGNCGEHSCPASELPLFGLDWAWREVAKGSSEAAREEIERLEKALKKAKEENSKLREELEIRHCYNKDSL